MKDFFLKNRTAVMWGMTALSALILASVVAGCQLQDIIKFEPPKHVQEAIGVSDSMPLSEANYTWDEWQRYVTTNSERLSDEIGEASLRFDLVSSVTDTGLSLLGESAGSFPGGALIFGGLSMLAGIYTKRPGTDKHVSAEKQASFNKGLAEGKRVAIEMYEEMRNAPAES